MENKIYYGEYSLKHWIFLMLNGNIILPEFQRSFVWTEKDVKQFIKSINEKQFIPPVTIAHYKIENEKSKNYILDGQQRLTSLLLAAIGYFPNKNKFEKADAITSEDDSEEERNVPILWTFERLFEFGKSVEKIKNEISNSDKYNKLQIGNVKIDENFLENIFFGFSYIVPVSEEKDEVQKDFSRTFREINYFGKSLSPQESRRSLYFMNDKYKDFFDGKINDEDVLSALTITEKMKVTKIDFVRYLSILSQYKIQGSAEKVLEHYSKYASRESFYVDFVSFVVGIEQEDYEEKFDGFEMEKIFPNDFWKERFEILKLKTNELKKLLSKNKKRVFESWIDVDYYLFGLIYFVLFENKKVEFEEKLMTKLQSVINAKRKDSKYSKSPNRLENLRKRLSESIKIYSEFVK